MSEQNGAKFPVTTRAYSMVEISSLDAFSEFFELEASPVGGQSLLPGKRKEKWKKERQKINSLIKN